METAKANSTATDSPGGAAGLNVADIDNDGFIDIYDGTRLFRNVDGRRFEEDREAVPEYDSRYMGFVSATGTGTATSTFIVAISAARPASIETTEARSLPLSGRHTPAKRTAPAPVTLTVISMSISMSATIG